MHSLQSRLSFFGRFCGYGADFGARSERVRTTLVRTEEEGKRQKGGATRNIDSTNLRHSAKKKKERKKKEGKEKRKKEVAVFLQTSSEKEPKVGDTHIDIVNRILGFIGVAPYLLVIVLAIQLS